MSEYRPELPPLPERMKDLKLDDRGYPVPWFVPWLDGKPEFRAITAGRMVEAYNERRCWICGGVRGSYQAFVIGPMCAINRISGEPPSHRECAIYAARACPFLTRPYMHRRENDLPEGVKFNENHLDRNPGVAMVWITKTFRVIPLERLFEMGDPLEILYFCEGRQATRDEVIKSIDDGITTLQEIARGEGSAAVRELDRRYDEVKKMVMEEL